MDSLRNASNSTIFSWFLMAFGICILIFVIYRIYLWITADKFTDFYNSDMESGNKHKVVSGVGDGGSTLRKEGSDYHTGIDTKDPAAIRAHMSYDHQGNVTETPEEISFNDPIRFLNRDDIGNSGNLFPQLMN